MCLADSAGKVRRVQAGIGTRECERRHGEDSTVGSAQVEGRADVRRSSSCRSTRGPTNDTAFSQAPLTTGNSEPATCRVSPAFGPASSRSTDSHYTSVSSSVAARSSSLPRPCATVTVSTHCTAPFRTVTRCIHIPAPLLVTTSPLKPSCLCHVAHSCSHYPASSLCMVSAAHWLQASVSPSHLAIPFRHPAIWHRLPLLSDGASRACCNLSARLCSLPRSSCLRLASVVVVLFRTFSSHFRLVSFMSLRF